MELQSAPVRRVKVLATIVCRGQGERVTELLESRGVTFHLVCLGMGTARTEILDYLGLGETEKDVVISVVLEEEVPELLEMLTRELQLHKPGNGILFTVPIASVGGPITLQYISGLFVKEVE